MFNRMLDPDEARLAGELTQVSQDVLGEDETLPLKFSRIFILREWTGSRAMVVGLEPKTPRCCASILKGRKS
jgi:hypothetical protein